MGIQRRKHAGPGEFSKMNRAKSTPLAFSIDSGVAIAMSLIVCPDCGSRISDASPACIRCGRPNIGLEPRSTDHGQAVPQTEIAQSVQQATLGLIDTARFPLFPVTTQKFIVLSVCTLGIYNLYWSYQNWERIRAETGENLSPFWRAFFAALWNFSLFGRIHTIAGKRNISAPWSSGLLGIGVLIASALWKLPEPWSILTLLSFLPYIPVLQTVSNINRSSTDHIGESRNGHYSAANITTIVIGGIVVVLAIIGSFLP
jgi:hypothetical protein